MIDVTIIPILRDNYAYLLHAPEGATAILDAGESAPIISVLESKNLTPTMILSTHHHGDHVAGNEALKEKYACQLFAPEGDSAKMTGVDKTLCEGDSVMIGNTKAYIIAARGHTAGGMCVYVPDAQALFTGDTLFSMGCGRLFEGTAQEMFDTLQKIAALPVDTMIYCGHEYTLTNGAFALSLAPDNPDIQARIRESQDLRTRNLPTLPVSLATEKKTNPFLKAKSAEDFAALRKKRDVF